MGIKINMSYGMQKSSTFFSTWSGKLCLFFIVASPKKNPIERDSETIDIKLLEEGYYSVLRYLFILILDVYFQWQRSHVIMTDISIS